MIIAASETRIQFEKKKKSKTESNFFFKKEIEKKMNDSDSIFINVL